MAERRGRDGRAKREKKKREEKMRDKGKVKVRRSENPMGEMRG